MRRLVLAMLLSVPLACGIVYSPGDFLEPAPSGSTTNDGGSAGNADTGTTTGEGGASLDAGPKDVRVALFSGRRDAVDGEPAGAVNIAETLLTSIHADGTIAPWAYDSAPPTTSLWTHALLVGGSVYVHNTTAIARASFTDHVTSAWAQGTIPAAPALQSGIRPWLLDERGVASGRSLGPTATAMTWFASLADGGAGSASGWATTATATTVTRGDATLLRAGTFVYALGGQLPATDRAGTATYTSEVEVSKRADDGTLGNFAPTAPLAALDGGAYTVFLPVAVAGSDRIFVLGGLPTTNGTASSNVAMAARIADPTTGALDPWVVLPPLPQPISAFAAIVTPAWVVVFGGDSAGKASDGVLRLAIHADGTYGAQWERAGSLPSGRSYLVGVGY